MSQLAILGGEPAITYPMAAFRTLTDEVRRRGHEVLDRESLSGFLGQPGHGFLGGPEVIACEATLAASFGATTAVTFNSWTSGLEASLAALGVSPGDEVITTPWTMSACAAAILHCGGVPVFADICPRTFNIDPTSVDERVGPRTVGILSVDIFGLPGDYRELAELAQRRGLFWMVDSAQSPGATYDGRPSGSLADVWGYSFNYHKHIQSGEGGAALTNSPVTAERLQRIRNHGENAVRHSDTDETLSNMIGHNFRLGEIEAALISAQLPLLADRISSRQRAAQRIASGISSLDGVSISEVPVGRTHAYYVLGMTLALTETGLERRSIVDALRAEGVPNVMAGYQNLHRLPMVKRQIGFGSGGFPWRYQAFARSESGRSSTSECAVAERLHDEEFLGLLMCSHQLEDGDCDAIIGAFHKVWKQRHQLRP